MMASNVDENNNLIKSYNAIYNVGDALVREHLDSFVKDKKLVRHRENGLVYYNTSPNSMTTVATDYARNVKPDDRKSTDENTKCPT